MKQDSHKIHNHAINHWTSPLKEYWVTTGLLCQCSLSISKENSTSYHSLKDKKGKVVPVHNKKAYGRHTRIIALLIPKNGTRWRSVIVTFQLFYPQERSLVPIKYEAGWAQSQIGNLGGEKNLLYHATIQILIIQPENQLLYQLHCPGSSTVKNSENISFWNLSSAF